MAKKIIIDFSEQPIIYTFGFSYEVEVNGYLIYYSNGESEVNIQYIANGGTPATINELPIGLTLDETLQITLSYLRENFATSIVQYNIVGNAIEVTINADATVFLGVDINASIDLSVVEIEPSGINLIYYLYFDNYILNIYKKNYLGNSTEIFGSFAIKKSSVDTILEPIRGTGLQLSVEANSALTFDEFLLDDEFTYRAELLKNGVTIFNGYIKPDGTQQSFVNDLWLVNIEASDGLGALKDLSFVQSNGTHFAGKMSFYDVIKGCLDRTHLSMDICTSIGIEYVGYTGSNILKDVYVNAERFIKDGNDPVLMDCNEVLTSILNLFSGIIIQQDGKWWICRPNDLVLNGYTEFINQTTNVTFTKNLNAALGSQINNFYPHHCDSNQQIEVKGAISAYRINYQYGFLDGFVNNPNLNHDEDLNYDYWTVDGSLPTGILINDPTRVSGALMKSRSHPSSFFLTEVLTSTPFTALAGKALTFRCKVSASTSRHTFHFKIKTSDGYFLNENNVWVLGESSNPNVGATTGKVFEFVETFSDFQLLMAPVLNDCTIEVIICRPYSQISLTGEVLCNVSYCQILDNTIKESGIVGEFHTVSRKLPPSSITKENQKVFNGDSEAILIGAIYKEDLETLTDLWTRKGKFENLPLLGISAMDDLRIQPNPVKVFSGSIFGEIPYLSVVTIDGILGLFMFIEYDYDYQSNKSTIKLMQFYNDDLGDISYQISSDYGNSAIKPTIKG